MALDENLPLFDISILVPIIQAPRHIIVRRILVEGIDESGLTTSFKKLIVRGSPVLAGGRPNMSINCSRKTVALLVQVKLKGDNTHAKDGREIPVNVKFASVIEINSDSRYSKESNHSYKISKQYRGLSYTEIQAAYTLFASANPTRNLPLSIRIRPPVEYPRATPANIENIVNVAMESKSGDNIEEQPIDSSSLQLTPEDTEAVLTLVALKQNRRALIKSAQPSGQDKPVAPLQGGRKSNTTTDSSSDSVSSSSRVSWSPSWKFEKSDEQDNDDDGSNPEVTSSKHPSKYDCNQCGKYYATSSNLSRHKQTHRSLNSELAQRCSDCNKVYVSMSALAMHALTHRMRHACRECGKHFSRPWLLRGHLRLHTGEKPYKCIVCGKSFADRSNLRAHLQTHSPDKKFECMRCNKTFALKTYLNKHHESACARINNN